MSALSHLAGCLFAAYAALFLVRLAGDDRVKRLSLAVFGASMVALYAASGLYHSIPLPADSSTVGLFRRIDLSCIYLLIAGTYTPIFGVVLSGRLRSTLLSAVWSVVAVGIAAKWLLPAVPQVLNVGLYLAVGLLGFIPAVGLIGRVGLRAAFWGLAGGAAYLLGAMIELAGRPVLVPGFVGAHEVFHLCVMAGTTMHVIFMLRTILPYEAPVAEAEAEARPDLVPVAG